MSSRGRADQRTWRAKLAATVVAAFSGVAMIGMSVAGASPALADTTTDPITLSSDGVIYSTALAGGLFDDFQGVVPGDSVTKSFWVKNPLDAPVTVKTRATNVTSSSTELEQSITVSGMIATRSLAAPVTLASLADCSTLAPDVVLAAHAVAKVSITLAMLNVSGKTAQASAGGFDVLMSMQDDAAGAGTPSCDDPGNGGNNGGGGHNGGGNNGGGDNHSGGGTDNGGTHGGSGNGGDNEIAGGGLLGSPLAFTGFDALGPFVAGMGLMGVGLFFFLLAKRRRREREE